MVYGYTNTLQDCETAFAIVDNAKVNGAMLGYFGLLRYRELSDTNLSFVILRRDISPDGDLARRVMEYEAKNHLHVPDCAVLANIVYGQIELVDAYKRELDAIMNAVGMIPL